MCVACEAVRINGVLCHERGCPEAWRDEIRECRWCGSDFKPYEKRQTVCSDTCADADCEAHCLKGRW